MRASDDPRELGPADVVLFTVKLYDAERAAAQLAPLIGPDTMVVTLQNGVDAVDIVARHVGREHTAGGVAYVAAVIDPPGTIRHTALDALIVGELDGTMSPRLLALKAAPRSRRVRLHRQSAHPRRPVVEVRAALGLQRDDLDHALAARRPARRSRS